MTDSKIREFEARLDELARIFPPPRSREDVIKSLAIRLTPSEDLMIIARMFRAGRYLQPADEREFQARAAYVLAVQKAVELTDGVSKRKKTARLIDTGSEPSARPVP